MVTVYSGLQAFAKRVGGGMTVGQAKGCEIKLGAANAADLAEAVALHEASDATVLVVGDSTSNSIGFSAESCGKHTKQSHHNVIPGVSLTDCF